MMRSREPLVDRGPWGIGDRNVDSETVQWQVDWASPWTWLRLALAVMALSLCVSSALLAADFGHARLVELAGRTAGFDWPNEPAAAMAARTVVQGAIIAVVLAIAIQCVSLALTLLRRPKLSAGNEGKAEQRIIRRVWMTLMFQTSLSSIFIVMVSENHFSYTNIFDQSSYHNSYIFAFIAFLVVWAVFAERLYLKMLRKLLVRRIRSSASDNRRPFIGSVAYASGFAVLAAAVTLVLFWVAAFEIRIV